MGERPERVSALHRFRFSVAADWSRVFESGRDVQLARFQGRPGTLSPKATLHLIAGKFFPSKFKYVISFAITRTLLFQSSH